MSNGCSRKPGEVGQPEENEPLAAATGEHIQPAEALDFTTPNVARIYDYYLGGKDNFVPDREAARMVLNAAPDIPLAALENREFVKRAVEFLSLEAGIDQFIDIGPGPLRATWEALRAYGTG